MSRLAWLFGVSMALCTTSSMATTHGEHVQVPSQAGWEKLGERTVNGKMDRDIIDVGADDGTFTAIRVKVEGSSLVMHEIRVVFLNGETFEPKTRLVFGKNSQSRIIDLPGNKRVIKRVEFKYSNLPGGGNASVELWGKK
jgi:hypothetical protein